jgi:hypothetical protein
MSKEETREKIIVAIKKNFTVDDDDFLHDGFIEMSVSGNFQSHEEFEKKLSGILNKIFPKNKNQIIVNTCDTINDILNNNFKFD